MARQLIRIVRCFKQLKAEPNMDRGAERNGGVRRNLHGKLFRYNYLIIYYVLRQCTLKKKKEYSYYRRTAVLNKNN